MDETEKQQLFGRFHHLTDHLKILNDLLTVNVSEHDLLPVDKTNRLLDSSVLWRSNQPFFFATVKFEDGSIMAKHFISKFASHKCSPYIVVTKYSLDCGATIIPSLDVVSYVFPWEGDEVYFLSQDDTEMIFLSWYEDSDGKRKMDILFFHDFGSMITE